MLKFESIGVNYAAWWERIAPPNCSPVQREEMRRAFYSGAFAMFLMMQRAAGHPEARAMEQMQEWEAELASFIGVLKHMSIPKESKNEVSKGENGGV